MNNAATQYTVLSCNFSWHQPVPAASYEAALQTARQRWFEATIRKGDELVASWSPLYGTRVYDRALAR
jgi:hypothetical protein